MKRRIKSGLGLITALLLTSCGTTSDLNNVSIKPSEKIVSTILTEQEIKEFDRVYGFGIKDLSDDFVTRKLQEMKDYYVNNANDPVMGTKILRELEYLRIRQLSQVNNVLSNPSNVALYNSLAAVTAVSGNTDATFRSFFDLTASPASLVIYVDADAPGGNPHDGTSWANAYLSLQQALNDTTPGTATSIKSIWVANGTYKPSSHTSSFQLKPFVKVYGGFAGNNRPVEPETQLSQRNISANLTILSGDIAGSVGVADAGDCWHVVKGSNSTLLDGFTVRHGFANGGSVENDGAGMYNDSSSPTISNVTFTGNIAANKGGGMVNRTNSSPVLNNVTFTSNIGTNGGAMYNTASSNPNLNNVTFNLNSATNGGAMYNNSSSPTLTQVTFTDNTGGILGGGMLNESSSSPVLNNVTFNSNDTTAGSSHGGGMYNRINSAPVLNNVTFTANTCVTFGGGMHNFNNSSPVLNNVTFTDNEALKGGALYFEDNSNGIVKNSTFSSNEGTDQGGAIEIISSSPTITDSTFSANEAVNGGAIFVYLNSAPQISGSTFTGNTVTSNGGAMFIQANSNVTIIKSTFEGNTATTPASSRAGGIYSTGSTSTIKESTFKGNTSTLEGGAIYNTNSTSTITNVTFSNNQSQYGGGLFNNTSTATVTNSTFSNNTATVSGTGYGGGLFSQVNSNTTLRNTIFWGNTASLPVNGISIAIDTNDTLKIGYSNIEGGFDQIRSTNGSVIRNLDNVTLNSGNFGTIGFNLLVNPLFADANDIDGVDGVHRTSDDGLRLQTGSPSKNSGTNTGAPNSDITGRFRPLGSSTDMGAYEFSE